MVDFGLAQAYDKSSENIFVYEKLNKTKSTTKTENSPLKKNLIAISSSKRSSMYNNNNNNNNNNNSINSNNSNSTSSHLILTKNQVNQSKAEINSLPHAPSKESFLSNSQSFDSNLSDAAINKAALVQRTPSPVAANNRQAALANNKNTPNIANIKSSLNSPKVKTPNSSTFQKFYSFQKSSFSMNENKCACFNTQFVCEICTARFYFNFTFDFIIFRLTN